jgi:AMP deaminase
MYSDLSGLFILTLRVFSFQVLLSLSLTYIVQTCLLTICVMFYIGQSRLREIFLKTENHIQGRYLAEMTREVSI